MFSVLKDGNTTNVRLPLSVLFDTCISIYTITSTTTHSTLFLCTSPPSPRPCVRFPLFSPCQPVEYCSPSGGTLSLGIRLTFSTLLDG